MALDDETYKQLQVRAMDAFIAFLLASTKPGALWVDVHALEVEWKRLRSMQTAWACGRVGEYEALEAAGRHA